MGSLGGFQRYLPLSPGGLGFLAAPPVQHCPRETNNQKHKLEPQPEVSWLPPKGRQRNRGKKTCWELTESHWF